MIYYPVSVGDLLNGILDVTSIFDDRLGLIVVFFVEEIIFILFEVEHPPDGDDVSA